MCKNQGIVPRVAFEQLWSAFNKLGFRRGHFLVLKGYIDESYNKRVFTLSAILGAGLDWAWFASRWKKCIAAKNKVLKAQGRPQISRFHASDCESRRGEFEGWTVSEQIEFIKGLIAVFRTGRRPRFITAYTMPLESFAKEFPKDARSPLKPCYALLIKYLMIEVADQYEKAKGRGEVRPISIALIHDRSSYDATILRAFNQFVGDETFGGRAYFSSITPLGWENCIPLQAADLVAYENMKEADRIVAQDRRDRRKSLAALLDLPSLGGRTIRFTGDSVHNLRVAVEEKRRMESP